ncbi:MAG: helix-hairpin-helix domain-containing protein, partial [Prevotella sp.]|nr:helix-hairpin-helix domain-containing protein [Prevotella sp.]
NFTFPVFFGEGMRGAVLLRADITPNLTVIGKAGTTKYFDRNHISSSLQQIDKSHKTDIDLQVKWKF